MHATAWCFRLETGNTERVSRVFDVDDVPAPAVIHGVDMVLVDEHVVHTSGEAVIERGEDLDIMWVGDVEKDEAVAAIRRAFTADDAGAAVRGDFDIVDRTRVDLNRVDELHVGGVGDVIKIRVAFRVPRAVDGVVASVDPFPDPKIRSDAIRDPCMAEKLDLSGNVSRCDENTRARDPIAGHGDDRIDTRLLGDETAEGVDLCRGSCAHGFRTVRIRA